MKRHRKPPSPEKLRYVTEEGKPVAVILDLSAYRALLKRLEELEDALELKDAIQKAEGFTGLDNVREEVDSEGNL